MKKVCFYILLLLTGCSVQHPSADAIATLFAEYKIDDYNYSIMDTNGVIQKSDYIEKNNYRIRMGGFFHFADNSDQRNRE
ncbi:hypothetical protein NXV57_01530 [Bacteroides thetaiotaomicron]|nr:hypothetical protein [Bacteroides thetaiotaomicron]